MFKNEFIHLIALEFKMRSGASFNLSNRQYKYFRRWILKQNKKFHLLNKNEIKSLSNWNGKKKN